MLRDFFLGFVRIHILHHAAREAVFGSGLIQELRRHGYRLSPGTLYPILHRLQQEKLLELKSELVLGKIRKYYRATPRGRALLKQARLKIRELVTEVLEE